VWYPCFRPFLFPIGGPGDFPPCIRQRPFFIAGDWQALPLAFVRAPHLGLRCMGKQVKNEVSNEPLKGVERMPGS